MSGRSRRARSTASLPVVASPTTVRSGRSVRSTHLTMAFAIAAAVVLGALDTTSVAHHWAVMSAADRAGFDPVGDSFAGFQLGELAFGVLGVLAISAEYGTGLIRSTLTAVPRRGVVFAAKAAVVGVLSLVLGELFAFVAFFLGQFMLAAGHLDVHLGDPGVLRAVLCGGLYLCTVTMVGVRPRRGHPHSAGAIAAMFALIYLAYGAARAVEGWSWLPDRLLLTNASLVLAQVHVPVGPRSPSIGLAAVDLVVYVVAALALGRVAQLA